jgi:hypothetical protein
MNLKQLLQSMQEERITEGRKQHNPNKGSLALSRPGRGHGSGPSTRTENLGGKKEGRGIIYKSTVLDTGSRSSGKGLKRGQVTYSRLSNRPRSETHPGKEHGPLANVPAMTPAPIEGRVRDVVRKVKRGGQKAVGAVKKLASRIRGRKNS